MINEINVFPNFIYTSELSHISTNKVSDECYEIYKNKDGRSVSNKGGWQSEDINAEDLIDMSEVSSLLETTQQICSSIYTRWGIKNGTANLSNFWININRKNNFNLQHNHPGNILSCVYYAKCNKDSGSIVFERPDDMELFFGTNTVTDYTYLSYTIDPQPGNIIVFPSFFKHYVNPNSSEDDRISIAFNFN